MWDMIRMFFFFCVCLVVMPFVLAFGALMVFAISMHEKYLKWKGLNDEEEYEPDW